MYESLLNDVCIFLFDHLSPTIGKIKDLFFSEHLRFFREKPLKEFWWHPDLGNFFHHENFEESGRDDNSMEQSQDYKEDAAKHPRKTRIVFRGCAKMCVDGSCRDGRSRPSYWSILGASAEAFLKRSSCSQYLAAWFSFLGTAHNKPFSWYPIKSIASPFSGEVQL